MGQLQGEVERPTAEAEAIWKSFGKTKALQDVSVSVLPGECHALVGRNGAGKSTLVAILTGLLKPDGGAVRLFGEPAPNLADRSAWQARVACVAPTVASWIALRRACCWRLSPFGSLSAATTRS